MSLEEIQTTVAHVLERPKISPTEARDALFLCFCALNRKFREKGARLLGKELTADEMDAISERVFRKLFSELGADYKNPTREALEKVKERMEAQLRYREHDPELMKRHDAVCVKLLEKVTDCTAPERLSR